MNSTNDRFPYSAEIYRNRLFVEFSGTLLSKNCKIYDYMNNQI